MGRLSSQESAIEIHPVIELPSLCVTPEGVYSTCLHQH